MIVDHGSNGFFHIPTRNGPGQRLAGFGRFGNVPLSSTLLTSQPTGATAAPTDFWGSILGSVIGVAGNVVPGILGANTAASNAAAAQAQAQAAAAAAAAATAGGRPATDWSKIALYGGGAVVGLLVLSMALGGRR